MKEHISFAQEMQIPFNLKLKMEILFKFLKIKNQKLLIKAPTGKIYLDGNVAVGIDSNSIKERKNISINGLLEITLIIIK